MTFDDLMEERKLAQSQINVSFGPGIQTATYASTNFLNSLYYNPTEAHLRNLSFSRGPVSSGPIDELRRRVKEVCWNPKEAM